MLNAKQDFQREHPPLRPFVLHYQTLNAHKHGIKSSQRDSLSSHYQNCKNTSFNMPMHAHTKRLILQTFQHSFAI